MQSRIMQRRKPPLAFAEHGATMAATLVNTPRAVDVSVYVMRAFVQLREPVSSHRDLAKRLDALEQNTQALALKHDAFSRNTRIPPDRNLDTHSSPQTETWRHRNLDTHSSPQTETWTPERNLERNLDTHSSPCGQKPGHPFFSLPTQKPGRNLDTHSSPCQVSHASVHSASQPKFGWVTLCDAALRVCLGESP
jgi:hypothetical protein